MSDGKVEENIIGQGCGMLRWNDATDYREAREIALWAAVTDTRLERARWKARMRREALQGAPWNQ